MPKLQTTAQIDCVVQTIMTVQLCTPPTSACGRAFCYRTGSQFVTTSVKNRNRTMGVDSVDTKWVS
eukprot:COSAG01_NODE_6746_length_3518_cov_74.761041_2_plen_66_part_00